MKLWLTVYSPESWEYHCPKNVTLLLCYFSILGVLGGTGHVPPLTARALTQKLIPVIFSPVSMSGPCGFPCLLENFVLLILKRMSIIGCPEFLSFY